MFDSKQAALKYIKNNNIDMVDLKISGILGRWLHITIPAVSFADYHFEEGVGYDGSSGAGFGSVESGDVVARPEVETAFIDPFCDLPTISFLCETVRADTKEPFARDPRTIARKAETYLRSTGIADDVLMAPEFEFHVFDQIIIANDPYHTQVDIRSSEVESDGFSPAISPKGGYLAIAPTEQLHDLRSEIAMILGEMGINVRYHHHEVGAPGQCEIEVGLQPLVRAADQAMIIKYVVKNVARGYGQIATFMPKPVHGEAGNGMHVHQRLVKDGKPVFYDPDPNKYGGLSDAALSYIGGLLKHGRALAGITNPSTNSFKRLVPGYEAPVNLFYSLANRSAAIRVPKYAVSPDEKRIEYRPPDFSGNVHVALASMLMAGLDGMLHSIDPAKEHMGPFDVDIAKQPAEVRSQISALPVSLAESLDALLEDYDFLTQGDVMPPGFIKGWAAYKREKEVNAIVTRPHPYEYAMYLDV